MLYLFDEYIKEYPKRYTSALEKFKPYTKNLHEMSFNEVQEAVNKWKPLSERTAYNQRKQIYNYFLWLKTKNIKVDLTIPVKIKVPLEPKMFLIYSTADIAFYYNELFKYLEKQCTLNGTTFSKKTYYMSFAASILAFYGMTEEQILSLSLSDVQIEGVKGYENLPLTENDIKVLLAYKNITRYANNMPLLGTTYIRSAKQLEIDKAFLSRPVWRVELDENNAYLKNLLRVGNIYDLGVLNRLYEKDSNKSIELGQKNTPNWFGEIIGSHVTNTITNYKKEYLAYRKERDSVQEHRTDYDISILQEGDYLEGNLNVEKEILIEKKNAEKQAKIDTLDAKVNTILDSIQTLATELKNIKNEINKIK